MNSDCSCGCRARWEMPFIIWKDFVAELWIVHQVPAKIAQIIKSKLTKENSC